MKRFALLCLLALAMAAPTLAASYNGLAWNWVAPAPIAGITVQGYNLYVINSTCPATISTSGMTPVNGASLITSTSYTQTTNLPTSNICAFVTAVSTMGVEGPPSATFQGNVGAPGPPSGLTPRVIP